MQWDEVTGVNEHKVVELFGFNTCFYAMDGNSGNSMKATKSKLKF